MRVIRSGALLVVLGGGFAAAVTTRQWVTVSVSDEALPLTDLTFTGRELVPSAYALMLCSLVLLLGMPLVKNWLRKFFAFVGVLASVVAVVELFQFLGDTSPVLAELIAQTLGRELVQSAVVLNVLPHLAIAAMLISAVGHAWILAFSRSGGGLSNKYERINKSDVNAKLGTNSAGPQQNIQQNEEINPWSALDAGIDPTI